MTKEQKNTNIKIVFALTLIHFTGDFYSSFAIPLFPVFVDKLSLSMAQIGLIAGIVRLLAFIVQPCIGYLSDRYQTRFFALGGLLLTITFIPLSGIAPSYLLLTLVLAIGSIGSSMFHPSVTGMIPLYGGKNAGFSMSIFNTGGILAFGLGPLFITWYVSKYGLSYMPVTMLFGLPLMIFLARTVPVPISEGLNRSGFFGSIKDAIGKVWKSVALIWIVMVLRAVVGQSFLTFMPVMLTKTGYSLVSIGIIISLFITAGTFSGLIAGYLSDKIGFKPIFYFSYILMTPALLLFLYLPGNWVFVSASLAGFLLLATMSIAVVMAQTLAPKGRSIVASLMMGFAYGTGGAISPLVGKLADIFSIEQVLFYMAFIPILILIPIFFFPNIGPGSKIK